MRQMTLEEVCQAVAGRWIRSGRQMFISAVTTDTRKASPGGLFVALRGGNFDGHDFLAQAADGGCAAAMVDERANVAPDVAGRFPGGVLCVSDTVLALGDLAKVYRRTLAGTIISVTGSNGKTTVKRMIHHVLSRKMKGLPSPKSFNNNIGVPLTLLSAGPDDRYVICETGSNAPGEIATLAAIIRPDIAVITSVGPTHLEKLIDVAGVAAEKASLLGELGPDGVAIVNADSAPLAEALKAYQSVEQRGTGVSPVARRREKVEELMGETPMLRGRRTHGRDAHATKTDTTATAGYAGMRMVRFGEAESADLRLSGYEATEGGGRFEVNGKEWFTLAVPGRHMAMNALAAVGVGMQMGLDLSEAAEALAEYRGEEMRLQIVQAGQVRIINDAYNANPSSMRAAADAMKSFPARRRVLVVGDMLELGSQSPQLHEQTGQVLAACGIDLIIGVGSLGGQIAAGAARTGATTAQMPSVESACELLPPLLRDGDLVLLKGSRGMAMERLVGPIQAVFDNGPHRPSRG